MELQCKQKKNQIPHSSFVCSFLLATCCSAAGIGEHSSDSNVRHSFAVYFLAVYLRDPTVKITAAVLQHKTLKVTLKLFLGGGGSTGFFWTLF